MNSQFLSEFNPFDVSLLCLDLNLRRPETSDALLDLLRKGKFAEVLQIEFSKSLLNIENDTPFTENDLKQRILDLITTEEESSDRPKTYQVLSLGIACLQLFVQANWVGPPLPEDLQINVEDSENILARDGEGLSPVVRNLSLLVVAKVIFQSCVSSAPGLKAAEIWSLHCVKIHQALLFERSPSLKEQALTLCDAISRWIESCTDELAWVRIGFHLKAAQMLYFFYEWHKSGEHLQQAFSLSGVTINLTGEMGRRTRYQQKDISQLVLQVEQNAEHNSADSSKVGVLPVNVALNDDTVLEKIKFTKEDAGDNQQEITVLQQLVILSQLMQYRRSHEGQGDIVKEESMAFITSLLENPQAWTVQSTALYLRSQWEKSSVRRVERSMSQLEELVNQHGRPTPPGEQRLHYIYILQLPPIWEIQRTLANLMYEIGAVKSALELYLQVQMWDEVIKCYKALGETGRAEDIIREQISAHPKPSLYIHLGDVTNDPSYYEKAWELSKHRSAHAQRSLALFHLRKMEFEQSLEHFKLSLDLNTLQAGIWFSYGCALLACQNWSKAVTAFRRCVTVEMDNFEAWNNLAAAYVRLGQKERAHSSIQEALRCEFENWRLWDNYLLLSIDIGDFSEALRAYHRLLDIKDKFVNEEVIAVLVRAVNEDIVDISGKAAGSLRPKVQELMGRITSKITSSDALIWRHYGKLVLGKEGNTSEEMKTGARHLQKALRNLTMKSNWFRNIESCLTVCQIVQEVIQAYNEVANLESAKILSTVKLLVQPIISKVKLEEVDEKVDTKTGALKPVYKDLEKEVHQMQEAYAAVLQRIASS